MGAVDGNQWHEQRLTLTYLCMHFPHRSSITTAFDDVRHQHRNPLAKSKSESGIQGVHVRGFCFVILGPASSCSLPALCRVSQVFTTY
jgi:hypothetical protein